MRVLVTGGRGLLGEAVVAELSRRGHDVTSFQRSSAGERPGVREVLGDVADSDAVSAAAAGQQGIVHLAARVSVTGPWSEFARVNIDGTRNVLDAAEASGVGSVVHVSSPSVAHSGHPLMGVDAEPADPARARGNYARSKAAAEQLVLSRASGAMAISIVRPHLVWGPGDTQLVGRITERARRGRLVLIDRGRALIDTLYIDNAAVAIAQALDRSHLPAVRGRPLVLTNGEPRTVAEMVSRIAQAAGVNAPDRTVPYPLARIAGSAAEWTWRRLGRTDDPPLTRFVAEQLATAHWFDQRQSRSALDWEPHVSVDEGFERLRRHFSCAG
jgi:nucleoside-diphosphate-sugar epimerase